MKESAAELRVAEGLKALLGRCMGLKVVTFLSTCVLIQVTGQAERKLCD